MRPGARSGRNPWGGPSHNSPTFHFGFCEGMIEVWTSWDHVRPLAVCADWPSVIEVIREYLSLCEARVGPLTLPPIDFEANARKRASPAEALKTSVDLSSFDL